MNYLNIRKLEKVMNDNWWVIGETLKARGQEIRTLFERTYLRAAGSGGTRSRSFQRRSSRRLMGPTCACAEPAPCC